MNDLKQRKQLKDAYTQWMASNEPKYHLTLVFKPNSSETATRKVLNKLVIHLNRSLFKSRYKNGKSSLRGFVARERGKPTKLQYDKLVNCDHYHIIFSNNDDESKLVEFDSFLKHLDKQINYINLGPTKHGLVPTQFHEQNTPKHKWVIRDYLLQDYYEHDKFVNRLENYLMKICDNWSLSNDYVFDCLGLLGSDKVEFGRNSLKVFLGRYT